MAAKIGMQTLIAAAKGSLHGGAGEGKHIEGWRWGGDLSRNAHQKRRGSVRRPPAPPAAHPQPPPPSLASSVRRWHPAIMGSTCNFLYKSQRTWTSISFSLSKVTKRGSIRPSTFACANQHQLGDAPPRHLRHVVASYVQAEGGTQGLYLGSLYNTALLVIDHLVHGGRRRQSVCRALATVGGPREARGCCKWAGGGCEGGDSSRGHAQGCCVIRGRVPDTPRIITAPQQGLAIPAARVPSH